MFSLMSHLKGDSGGSGQAVPKKWTMKKDPAIPNQQPEQPEPSTKPKSWIYNIIYQ